MMCRLLQRSTERRVRRIIVALLAFTTTTHAQTVIFTYDQWERLSIGLQEIYLVGAIDSLFYDHHFSLGSHRQILQRLPGDKANIGTRYC